MQKINIDTPVIRQQLNVFYAAYKLWAENGAIYGGVFSRNHGLCANAWDYLELTGSDKEAVLEQLHIDFRSAGLNEVLPFNESKEAYLEECRCNMCHVNMARVAWVNTQIASACGGAREYELSVLVKRLSGQLKKVNPECRLPDKAMSYLERNGLEGIGGILR